MKHPFFMYLLFLCFALPLSVIAQIDEPSTESTDHFNYEAELAKMVSIPNSPEAEAFAQYGNTSVSLYTGTPNIGVPIYTYSGRELDLPISLSYDASGIKVEQLASQVGLGWNLNAGGRISRVVNGYPDTYISASGNYISMWNDTVRDNMLAYLDESTFFDTEQDVSDYFTFLEHVSSNLYETQPDYFSINAFGISDHIVFDVATREPYALDNPRLKVEFTKPSTNMSPITSWTITAENGMELTFALAERTHSISTDDGSVLYGMIKTYNSSWVLTQVISPNGKDTYNFSYQTAPNYWSQPRTASLVQSYSHNINDYNLGGQTHPAGPGRRVDSQYQIKQTYLTEISHNGKRIVSIDLGSRYDLDVNNAITNIKIYDQDTNNDAADLFKDYQLEHSYFKTSSGINPSNTAESSIRLKLDGLTIYNGSNDEYQQYSFDYASPNSLPSTHSLSQDYMGYFNGANNTNGILYPPIQLGDDFYEGANRTPSFNHTVRGMLTKITYPTGGHTTFDYEPHNVSQTNSANTQNTIIDASVSVTSTMTGSSYPDCGPCCLDKHGFIVPQVDSAVFTVEEDDQYRIQFSHSLPEINSSLVDAYLVKVSETASCASNPDGYGLDEIQGSACGNGLDEEIIWVSGINQPYDSQLFLTQGCYQIIIVRGAHAAGNDPASSTLTLSHTELENNTNSFNVEKAGLRVHTIKDYSDATTLAQEKKYQYTTTIDNVISSGHLTFDPQFIQFTNERIIQPNQVDPLAPFEGGIRIITNVTRVAHSSGGNRPHVAYSKVHEVVYDNAISNGYTTHEFFSAGSNYRSGVFSSGVTPNVNFYSNNFELGKQKSKKYYSDEGAITAMEESSYDDASYYINKGLYIQRDGQYNQTYTVAYQQQGGGHDGDWTYAQLEGFAAPSDDGINFTLNPPDVSHLTNPNFLGTEFAVLQQRFTSMAGKTGYMTNQKSYNGDPTTSVETSTTYSYDPSVNYLLRETVTNDSKGDELKTTYQYPQDVSGSVYTAMVTDNHISSPVRTEVYNNGTKLQTQQMNYIAQGPGYFPEVIQTAKGNNPLEDRMHIRYVNGNTVESFVEGLPTEGERVTSYIWGYDQRYPIAKIENVDYTTIEALPQFGNNFVINTNLSASQEQALRNLPNALVTTYEYIPLVGISSMTDHRGYTMTYEYDEQYRLLQVKDQDGKILNKNQYNYATSN